ALAAWPKAHPQFSAEQLAWYHRVERYQLRLLHLRQREITGSNRTPAGVDALFASRFDFANPSETYTPGRDLPEDATAVTEQLLLWLPRDDRLYWLLGEVLNATGNVENAASVLNELVSARNYNPGNKVREHCRILKDVKKPMPANPESTAPA